jgi:hypothetical protein
MIRPRVRHPLLCLKSALLCVALTIAAGCHTPTEKLAQQVKVTPAVAPLPVKPLPKLNTNRVQRMVVVSERGALETPVEKQFAAAREAFWNRETDTAVVLWRGLLTNSVSPQEQKHFQHLIVGAYAADRRWAEARSALEEFGFATKSSNYLSQLRFFEGLPPQSIRFAASADIPFELRLGQLVRAKARINGIDANVLVDTGFTETFITDEFARRAEVEVFSQSINLVDINRSKSSAKLGLIRELEFGGLRARHVRIISGPKRFLGAIFGDVDAVIGWDLLQHADVTWDFPTRHMSLREPPARNTNSPNLSGRRAPLLHVKSAEGRDLDLFLDTGSASSAADVGLVDNAGLLFTKVDRAQVRLRWRPTFTMGMHSFRVHWPKTIRPFQFWFDGHAFEIKRASLSRRVEMREGLQACDGIIGNAPFLKGKLRVCGVRRLASFELSESSD